MQLELYLNLNFFVTGKLNLKADTATLQKHFLCLCDLFMYLQSWDILKHTGSFFCWMEMVQHPVPYLLLTH